MKRGHAVTCNIRAVPYPFVCLGFSFTSATTPDRSNLPGKTCRNVSGRQRTDQPRDRRWYVERKRKNIWKVDGVPANQIIALAALDVQIGKSELLMSVAPIRLMSVGGFVSVKLFQNRNSTIDVDCLMDPNFDAVYEYRCEFWRAVRQVAVSLNHETDWLNDELRNFIRSSKRQDLFLESIEQDIVMYQGQNLMIFAGKMEWALERKIRRIANANRPRLKDIDDAVAVTKFIIDSCGGPLGADYVERLNRNGFDVANMRKGMAAVAARYMELHGEACFV